MDKLFSLPKNRCTTKINVLMIYLRQCSGTWSRLRALLRRIRGKIKTKKCISYLTLIKGFYFYGYLYLFIILKLFIRFIILYYKSICGLSYFYICTIHGKRIMKTQYLSFNPFSIKENVRS